MRIGPAIWLTLSLAPLARADDGLTTEVLNRVKAATVFIKADRGESPRSGSGFLFSVDGDTGVVVTNAHVVAQPAGAGLSPTNFTVVFRGGLKEEQVAEGTVVAIDKDWDIAILRVRGVKNLPTPLTDLRKDEPRETMTVFAAGYPFGTGLSLTKGNAAVSVARASVSSLRRDNSGDIARIELEGSLHPGNSGGPVVDKDGRLVGVVVARVSGSYIGVAVPPTAVTRMFDGRPGAIGWRVRKVTNGVAEVEVTVRLIDPLNKVSAVSVRVARNDSFDEFRPDKAGKWPMLPGAQVVELRVGDQVASGTIILKSREPSVAYFSVQPVFARTDKIPVHARPSDPLRVDFRLDTAANFPTAPFRSDAIVVTPKASGDWIYKEARRGCRLFTDADYVLAELPDEIAGGTLVVRKLAEGGTWLTPHALEAVADESVYVLFRWKRLGKQEVSEVVPAKLEREGWTEVKGTIETTFPDGEDWRWMAMRRNFKKGSVVLQLKTVHWPDAPALFVFKRGK